MDILPQIGKNKCNIFSRGPLYFFLLPALGVEDADGVGVELLLRRPQLFRQLVSLLRRLQQLPRDVSEAGRRPSRNVGVRSGSSMDFLRFRRQFQSGNEFEIVEEDPEKIR